jgi:hypothetical protein
MFTEIKLKCLTGRAAGIEEIRPARLAGLTAVRRGGDFRSHRKPTGSCPGSGGLSLKARLPPKKTRNGGKPIVGAAAAAHYPLFHSPFCYLYPGENYPLWEWLGFYADLPLP